MIDEGSRDLFVVGSRHFAREHHFVVGHLCTCAWQGSHVFVYTLGRDDLGGREKDSALRALDDVFLSKENRNFYTARLGISPERAAPTVDKPLGRICIRHLGKRDVYPSDTPDRLFAKCM